MFFSLFSCLLSQVDKVKQECRTKEESIRKLEESLQNVESKARGRDIISKNQQDKIKDLENQIESKAFLHLQSEKQVSNLAEKLKAREETCTSLQEMVFFNLGFPKLLQCYQFNYQFFQNSYSKNISCLLKVMELEKKLMEQGQFEAAAYEKKVLK